MKCRNCGKLEENHPERFCDGRWLNEDGSYNENFDKFTAITGDSK